MSHNPKRNACWTGTLLTALLLAAPAVRGDEPTPNLTPAQIEDIVKQYLLKNGDVILEGVSLHHKREREIRAEKSRQAIGQREKDLFEDPTAPVVGPASGEGPTIVAFLDYRCGYCKRVAPTVKAMLEKNPDARLVMKELPILGPESVLAAKAALAAHKQGAYSKFHAALIGSSEPVSAELIQKTAESLGLDAAKLQKDMDSPETETALQRNRELAEALGVNSTPTFVVGKELVAGAMTADVFQDLLDRTRKAVAQKQPAGR